MNTASKLIAYASALALVVVGAYAIGGAIGPLTPTTAAAEGDHGGAAAAGHGDDHGPTTATTADLPAGLASSRGGYTLSPADPTLTVGAPSTFAFRVAGPDGAPVTAFDVAHDKRLHLIVVRRDGSGFQHVHPEMAADGTWSIPLAVPAGGSYRAFADFAPTGGEPTVLGVDLAAAGDFQPVAPVESRTATVDGYTVELTGDLVPGRSSPVTLTVSRDGRPVTDLQPYLGAFGHLVALRQGDLAYLHVHPGGVPTPGPAIDFTAEVPSAGTYRLYLDFQHGDVVRTAEFTVSTLSTAPATAPTHDQPQGH